MDTDSKEPFLVVTDWFPKGIFCPSLGAEINSAPFPIENSHPFSQYHVWFSQWTVKKKIFFFFCRDHFFFTFFSETTTYYEKQ